VFLLGAVLLLTGWQLTLTARRHGFVWVVKSIGVAVASGLLAGVFIGMGARLGMSAISIANGDVPRFTLSGSLNVVSTFASFGIVLGIVYEGLFRRLLRQSGVAYGALIMLCSWYPLAHAAAQQLTHHPSLISQIIISGLVVALMWLPFGIVLEALLKRWLKRNDTAAPVVASAPA
jgi:hypothetical protein